MIIKIRTEAKIQAIELIIDTINKKLKGIDLKESTSKKVDYLNYRKKLNIEKLKECRKLPYEILSN